jgi:ATP-dependent Clp protease ATP-binding subunit ClpB
LNRLDEIVIFNRIHRAEITKIVDIQLARLQTRLARRALTIEFSQAAKDYIAQAGWDQEFGARPLKRAISRLVEDPLSRRILAGDFHPNAAIAVDLSSMGLTFQQKSLN